MLLTKFSNALVPVFEHCSKRAALIVMTTIFAALAMDIAYPALVLSGMAVSRWLVLLETDLAELRGKAA